MVLRLFGHKYFNKSLSVMSIVDFETMEDEFRNRILTRQLNNDANLFTPE